MQPTPISRGGAPDITILQASVDSLSKDLMRLEKDFNIQKNENKNIIIGVAIAVGSAFLAIVATVAVEVILFHAKS